VSRHEEAIDAPAGDDVRRAGLSEGTETEHDRGAGQQRAGGGERIGARHAWQRPASETPDRVG
jgi:hypothetical protein